MKPTIRRKGFTLVMMRALGLLVCVAGLLALALCTVGWWGLSQYKVNLPFVLVTGLHTFLGWEVVKQMRDLLR